MSKRKDSSSKGQGAELTFWYYYYYYYYSLLWLKPHRWLLLCRCVGPRGTVLTLGEALSDSLLRKRKTVGGLGGSLR